MCTSPRWRRVPGPRCCSSSTSRRCPRCSPECCRRRRVGARCGPCRPRTPRTCCATSSPASGRRWWCTAARRTRRCGSSPRSGWPGSGSTPRCPCSAARPRSRRRWTRWARCGTREFRCSSGWSRQCRAGPGRRTAPRPVRRKERPDAAVLHHPTSRPGLGRPGSAVRPAHPGSPGLRPGRPPRLRPLPPRRAGRPDADLRARGRDPGVGTPRDVPVARAGPGVRGPTGDLVIAAA